MEHPGVCGKRHALLKMAAGMCERCHETWTEKQGPCLPPMGERVNRHAGARTGDQLNTGARAGRARTRAGEELQPGRRAEGAGGVRATRRSS